MRSPFARLFPVAELTSSCHSRLPPREPAAPHRRTRPAASSSGQGASLSLTLQPRSLYESSRADTPLDRDGTVPRARRHPLVDPALARPPRLRLAHLAPPRAAPLARPAPRRRRRARRAAQEPRRGVDRDQEGAERHRQRRREHGGGCGGGLVGQLRVQLPRGSLLLSHRLCLNHELQPDASYPHARPQRIALSFLGALVIAAVEAFLYYRFFTRAARAEPAQPPRSSARAPAARGAGAGQAVGGLRGQGAAASEGAKQQ